MENTNQFLGTERVGKLMRRYAVPCIISLLVGALYNIVDQIFIANASYLGSYGNAANTVVFPLTVVALAIAVMIGDGCCAFVSISLGKGEVGEARKSVGSAVVLSVASSLVLTALYLIFADAIISMFGGTVNEETFHYAQEYFFYISLGIPFYMFGQAMNPVIRADGNPKFAMASTLAGAVINIILDPIFIFCFKWGMMGAALATSLGYILGAGMIVVYLSRRRNVIHFCRVKLSKKSMRLTWRNVKYMCHLGVSTFLCEAAIACMMFAGNYVFIHYLGEDGVAAFSIACYFFPIIFMVYNAIGQSAQPILSYNFGAGDTMRVRSAFRLALGTAVTCGLVFFALTALFNHQIVAMFIDRSYPAYDIAVAGLPLFASGFIFFAVNIVSIGYFQSVERARPAMMVTVLRGFVFMVLCLLGLPLLLKVPGIWLAVPLAEILTFLVIMAIYYRKHQWVRR